MGKTEEYFHRLDDYVLAILVVKRMLDENVITKEIYYQMEKELAKEFNVRNSLKRDDFKEKIK